jgi:hypothetical protein
VAGPIYISAMATAVPAADPVVAYEAPALLVLGGVAENTLRGDSGCYWGKQFGGSDGFTFMGISVPISNCSS